MNMTKLYELMVLIPGSSTADDVKATTGAITKLVAAKKGKVEKEESLGKKFLAYKIKKQTEAFYLYFEVSLDTSEAQAFERDVRLMENIIRSLFVIKEV